jgi:small subunit ribosomal protein S19
MPKGRKAKKVEVRRKKEFTLRGRTLPELQELPLSELAKLLSSRARRSIRRGFNSETTIFFEKLRAAPRDAVLRTHTRDALVLPDHVGRRIAIHTGKEFKEIEVRPEMIGHYYGEFALTRRLARSSSPSRRRRPTRS